MFFPYKTIFEIEGLLITVLRKILIMDSRFISPKMASSSMSKFFSCLLIIKLSVVELTVLIFDVRLLLIWHNNVSVLFAEFCNVSFVECVLKVINKKIIGNTATMTNSRISFDLSVKFKKRCTTYTTPFSSANYDPAIMFSKYKTN